MKQSKNKSRLETLVNFITAFTLGLLVTIFGIDVAVNEPIQFVLVLNVLSTARHYFWRRIFSKYVD